MGLTFGREVCLGQCGVLCRRRVWVRWGSDPEDVQHGWLGRGRAECAGDGVQSKEGTVLRAAEEAGTGTPESWAAESWSDGEMGWEVRRNETGGK